METPQSTVTTHPHDAPWPDLEKWLQLLAEAGDNKIFLTCSGPRRFLPSTKNRLLLAVESGNNSQESPPRLTRDTPSHPLERPWSLPQPGIFEGFIHMCLSLPTTNKRQTTNNKQANKNTILAFFLKKKKRSESPLNYGKNILRSFKNRTSCP